MARPVGHSWSAVVSIWSVGQTNQWGFGHPALLYGSAVLLELDLGEMEGGHLSKESCFLFPFNWRIDSTRRQEV